MKIVADNKIPYINGVLEPFAEVVYLPGRSITAEDVKDADALLVRTRTRCDETLLAGSRVRMVATATIGMDHIDSEWCRDAGVEIVSAPGCNAGGVLQWVSAVLASVVGDRCPADLTLGIVGVGHVGSLVEHAAADWGFRVLRSDPPREEAEGLGRKEGFVPLAELAAQADVVTFHVPMTKEGRHATAGLGGTDFFAALRDGAVVLNSSRGGIVDEMLWKEAVRNGCCRAVVDTWTGEPSIDRELLERAVFATPHIAGYSVQGKANASAAVISAVARRFGLPLEGWYPEGVRRVERRTIGWDDMRSSMCAYFDVETQSQLLKSNPEQFERFREEYAFREEFF